jgi:hypothetical protein
MRVTSNHFFATVTDPLLDLHAGINEMSEQLDNEPGKSTRSKEPTPSSKVQSVHPGPTLKSENVPSVPGFPPVSPVSPT